MGYCICFFLGGDGIRVRMVIGVLMCALPIFFLFFFFVFFCVFFFLFFPLVFFFSASCKYPQSVVYGKSVDLGGRRIIKKKKIKKRKKKDREQWLE